ncbi:MAG: 30S ribosomal protein S17 [Methylobacter sp.]|uniref:Small ribosomal subunit protein uS17 n=1 Tax=Candidatus Methylobacter titanis TaxID=3053457 RepID=A0AA43THQ4_9GAMM|nr:30S ribosomal protein S17 [Candidatus Methylobacter titanis]MDI1291669.1 30S ribosomal protein S17 [Candidatus Methylobacter titanis]MDO9168517.1 30S ribosomal protein S17 [Methylobacter sp.]MDO9423889.1 30S ribosomal protein S17 [Methylobacter sp.]
MSENVTKLRTITGRVVSNKMDKTITVLVERVVKHPVYGKYIKRSTKMMAHDDQNVCQEGDVVSITSCRPMSKNKTFRLVQVLESANK